MKQCESIQDKVYLKLRGDMLSLALEPGAVIRTQELADRLGVSRTPIREAFIRLQRDGLVKVFPQRETAVSLIDLARVRQEHFVRVSLELNVAGILAAGGRPDCLQAMNTLIEKQVLASVRGDTDTLYAYDNDFHRLMFEEAGQRFGWELLEQSCPHYHRVRLLSMRTRSVTETVVMGHQETLRALESGSKARLLDVLGQHLRQIDVDIPCLLAEYPQYFAKDTGV